MTRTRQKENGKRWSGKAHRRKQGRITMKIWLLGERTVET